MISTAKELDIAINNEILRAGKKYFECIANVEMIRPIVGAYKRAILNKHKFSIDSEYIDSGMVDTIIKTDDDAYLMSGEDFKIYLADLEIAKKGAGFDVPVDCCPLFMAQNKKLKAFRNLVDLLEPLTGIGYDNLHSLDNYDKYESIVNRMIATKLSTK